MFEIGSEEEEGDEDGARAEVTLVESSEVLEKLLPYVEGKRLVFDLKCDEAWDVIRAAVKYEVRLLSGAGSENAG